MSENVSRYIQALGALEDFLRDLFDYHRFPPIYPTTPLKWRGVLSEDLVADVIEGAKTLGLPTAAHFVEIPEKALQGLGITELPKSGPEVEWRVVGLTVFDPRMRWKTWPVFYEERDGEEWVCRERLLLKPDADLFGSKLSMAGHQFWMWSSLAEWRRDLSRPLDADGVDDTPYDRESWEDHCEERFNREWNQLRAVKGWPRVAGPAVPPAERLEQDKAREALRAKYRNAKVTPRYVKLAIENYMRDLDDMYLVKAKARGELAAPDGRDLKNIADWTEHFLHMALPLEFPDAPDIPGTDAMGPRAAYALLDKLRKCCIRRLRDDQERSLTAQTDAVSSGASSADDPLKAGDAYIPHAAAFAMLRMTRRDLTAKEKSRIMSDIREKAGSRLKYKKRGNAHWYHAGDWKAIADAIHVLSARKDDDAGGVEAYLGRRPDDPTPERIEAMKKELRSRRE